MDPVGIIGLVGSVASAGIGAIGASTTASAQANAANYQAQVARNNQIIAQQNASAATAAGGQAARNEDIKTAQIIGAEEAAQGASGLSVDSPSEEDVRSGTRQTGRLDAVTKAYNAQLQGRSEVTQATSFGEQAQLDTLTAQNAQTAGGLSTFSSILGGASSFADKWLSYQLKGVSGFAPNTGGVF